MKPELLVPAGNFESLKAGISAGCDAVYLGGKLFSARSFSFNFTDEEITESIIYAHLYGVKVYVTINTLIYDNEIDECLKYIDFLYKNNVDALIIQDIGLLDLVRKIYPLLEIHASTQMHIHNLDGVKLCEKLGIKRVVLARETNMENIKTIKKNTNMELEVFVHGALCISYSGQCLMSSLIGGRSGNRGSCAGSCRQLYDNKYLLSSKDLCTLENIGELIELGIESFKIEGRMKSASYVYIVTKLYRNAIDSYMKDKKVKIDENLLKDLKTIFNREFTKGYMFNETNVVNDYRPNHLGVPIGEVIDYKNEKVYIKLSDNLKVQDGIRFINEKDFGMTVINIFKNNEKVKEAYKGDIIHFSCNEEIKIKSRVLKTSDKYLINNIIKHDRFVYLKGSAIIRANEAIILKISDGINEFELSGECTQKAINNPLTRERIHEQLTKIGHTIYKFKELTIDSDENIFIPIKNLNDIKNKMIELLNEKRLYQYKYSKKDYEINLSDYPQEKNYNILIKPEFYEKIRKLKFKNIYTVENLNDERQIIKLERVINSYPQEKENILIGELGGLFESKNVYTDFSLNVANSYSVAFLHSLGVERITLSLELSFNQIKELINNYTKRYNKHPNLEVIVFGKEEVMVSKHIIDKDYIDDRFGNKYTIKIKNKTMYLYNYKTRNLKDDYFKIGINNIRYNIENIEDLNLYLNK